MEFCCLFNALVSKINDVEMSGDFGQAKGAASAEMPVCGGGGWKLVDVDAYNKNTMSCDTRFLRLS
jgi:hypothetical protein